MINSSEKGLINHNGFVISLELSTNSPYRMLVTGASEVSLLVCSLLVTEPCDACSIKPAALSVHSGRTKKPSAAVSQTLLYVCYFG